MNQSIRGFGNFGWKETPIFGHVCRYYRGFNVMVLLADLNVDEDHPLSLEISNLKAAVHRFQVSSSNGLRMSSDSVLVV